LDDPPDKKLGISSTDIIDKMITGDIFLANWQIISFIFYPNRNMLPPGLLKPEGQQGKN